MTVPSRPPPQAHQHTVDLNRAPQGWHQHLPPPLHSIFSEGTWTTIAKCARVAVEHGLGAALIREQRVGELHKFERSDVDELLDLADQLTMANDGAEKLQG